MTRDTEIPAIVVTIIRLLRVVILSLCELVGCVVQSSILLRVALSREYLAVEVLRYLSAAISKHPHIREPEDLCQMLRPCEEERRRQSIGDRSLVGDNPRRDHIAHRDARPGIEHVVQFVTPGASADRRCTQGAVFQVGHANHQMGGERVFKPDLDAGLTRMTEVSTTVDNELGESGLAKDLRDDVHEVALPRRSDIDHEWTPRDERCAVPDDVLRPGSSPLIVRLGSHKVGRGRKRVHPVVAKEFEVTANKRVYGTCGSRVELFIEIKESNRVVGEVEATTVRGGGNPRHEGVRAKLRVRGVELLDSIENALLQATG